MEKIDFENMTVGDAIKLNERERRQKMKLRNKKTGEIIETDAELSIKEPTSPTFGCPSYDIVASYNSLAELTEEWEDYEESDTYWFISDTGYILNVAKDGNTWDKFRKETGNYFETKEEAEKAVEKLKAWKRLKDKGFRFTGVAGISNNIFVSFESDSKYSGGHVMYDEYSNTDNNLRQYNEDLTLLFGGEE